MAFFKSEELKDLYQQAHDEAYEWRRNYNEYERLADNGLIDDLDETLPETNSGDLAGALYKLPKRIVDRDLTGRFTALDANEAWITELANIYWTNKIIPNANMQAPFQRKWKDAVRKSAIYGSQPIISLLMDNDEGDGAYADFIVPYAQDVYLEPGKVSDYDSDIIFWDVYYTNKQVETLIEQAKAEEDSEDSYSKWNVKALEKILEAQQKEDREANQEHEDKKDRSVTKGGIKFCIAFQRGIEAPFYMYHKSSDSTVREWTNPDPTGSIPVKYLYWAQDFNNPYGTGIVKLAGGTQNVIDEIQRLHVLATQIGVRPPKQIRGDETQVDEDSLIYAQDQNWYVGQADVDTVNMANGVYTQIPGSLSMYKTSLNKFLPLGDTTISGTDSGDPNVSKTPAGVKFTAAAQSVDDEDAKDNLYLTYEAVSQDLINLTFANMEGTDILKLTDEEVEKLMKAGLEFPLNENGEPETNELDVIWDQVRATFRFKLDPEEDEDSMLQEKIEGLTAALELRASDPTFDMAMMQSGKRFNVGEAYSTLMKLLTKNDKIIEDVDPEDQQLQPETSEVTEEQAMDNMDAVMVEYGVDETTAAEMLEAERQGVPPEEVQAALVQAQQEVPQ